MGRAVCPAAFATAAVLSARAGIWRLLPTAAADASARRRADPAFQPGLSTTGIPAVLPSHPFHMHVHHLILPRASLPDLPFERILDVHQALHPPSSGQITFHAYAPSGVPGPMPPYGQPTGGCSCFTVHVLIA